MLIRAVRVYVAMLADCGRIGHGHFEHSSTLPRNLCGGSTSTKSFLTSFSTSLHHIMLRRQNSPYFLLYHVCHGPSSIAIVVSY